MERVRWTKWSEKLRAAGDGGVISVREMVRLGVPERTVYRWCRHGGPCTKLLPGVVMLHTGTPTRREKEVAALIHAGPDAVLTGMSALRHQKLRRGADTDHVHVLIPAGRQVRTVGFALVERTTRMPRAIERDGLPVAPIVRAVLDRARRLLDPSDIAALLAEPVQSGWIQPQALHDELETGCRWGTAAVRPVVRAILDGVRSAAEFDAREWWLAHPELPPARFNVRLIDLDGRLVAVADIFLDGVGLVCEIDSTEYHYATAEQVAATLRRQRALHRVGLHVLSIRPAQRRDDPAGTLRDVLDAIAVAAALPPPQVTYEGDAPRAA